MSFAIKEDENLQLQQCTWEISRYILYDRNKKEKI